MYWPNTYTIETMPFEHSLNPVKITSFVSDTVEQQQCGWSNRFFVGTFPIFDWCVYISLSEPILARYTSRKTLTKLLVKRSNRTWGTMSSCKSRFNLWIGTRQICCPSCSSIPHMISASCGGILTDFLHVLTEQILSFTLSLDWVWCRCLQSLSLDVSAVSLRRVNLTPGRQVGLMAPVSRCLPTWVRWIRVTISRVQPRGRGPLVPPRCVLVSSGQHVSDTMAAVIITSVGLHVTPQSSTESWTNSSAQPPTPNWYLSPQKLQVSVWWTLRVGRQSWASLKLVLTALVWWNSSSCRSFLLLWRIRS